MSDMYYCQKGLDPDVPENWEKLEGVEPTGYSIGPVSVDEGSDWDSPVKVQPVYRRMALASGRGYDKSEAQRQMKAQAELFYRTPLAEYVAKGLGVPLLRWQSRVLGHWQETPREELRRRLNNWLQGTYPGEPINWKGLK